MGALKFITLAGGERVFEGGDLPGGYRLESISVDALYPEQEQSNHHLSIARFP